MRLASQRPEAGWGSGNPAMNSRFLSACLAAAMVVVLATEAWPQAASKPARRQQNADDAANAQEKSTAGGAEPAAPAADSFGSGDESKPKDPFDEAAAKVKGAGTKAGSSTEPKLEKATFGAGCFWHVEHEFEWLPGVKSAVSGYAGGHVPNPTYEMVHEGDTGHAEVVQVEYDPSVITYEQLLKVFWHGHDPTQWNRQGPDEGPQYRSVIFYHNEEQKKAALKSYRELTAARAYRAPIVTQLMPMKTFYRAEDYHQNYYGGKDDRPVGRPSRARRPGTRPVLKKGAAAAATAKAAAKKATAVAKPAEGEETGSAASAASPATGAPRSEP
jgi:peptide-methionine (S)-S-oxide reductase